MEEDALNLARQAEYLLDMEIARLGNLQTEDYEILREKRLQLMKLEYQQQQIWLANGHGTYRYNNGGNILINFVPLVVPSIVPLILLVKLETKIPFLISARQVEILSVISIGIIYFELLFDDRNISLVIVRLY
jgi:hypothetical protein